MSAKVELALLACACTGYCPSVPSVTAWCFACGTEVWVSHTMWPMVKSGEVRPACIPCAKDYMDRNDDTVAIHPRQVDELAQCGMLLFSMDLVDAINRRQRNQKKT